MIGDINIFDLNCPLGHLEKESHDLDLPHKFRSVDGYYEGCSNIVLTDMTLGHMRTFSKCDKKILWLMEPPSIYPHIYEFAEKFRHECAAVFTHNLSMTEEFDNFFYCPWGTCYIKEEDQKIYDKSKNISIVASPKRHAPGHILRHRIIEKFGDRLDGIKNGGKMEYKLPWMADYRYSVVPENAVYEGYYTEKILDCFKTGVIPIYWGDPSVLEVFDPNGIIYLRDGSLEEVDRALESATKDHYDSNLEAVRNNFEIADKYKYATKNLLDHGIAEVLSE